MNERIKELMKQADYPAPEIALRAQTLAELIIKDCTATMEQFVMMQVPPAMITGLVKKKYGVE